MARQVLPLVGAVAGFAVGGPTGAQIGFALGSLVGNAVDPIEMQGRKLGDSPTQVAAEGGARAIVYGKGCIRATCILERGGRRVIRQRDRSGGKGGGPTTINERALWTFAIGLGEPVDAILRIWENEKLVYDVTEASQIPEDTAAFSSRFRFYDGNETQLPDPALEALHGIGNTPYYRGTAYMVFPQYDLTDFGETVPTYRVEVSSAAVVVDPIAVNIWDKLIEWYDAGVNGLAIPGQHASDSLALRTRGAGPYNQLTIPAAVGDAVEFTGATGFNDSSGFASDFDSFLPSDLNDRDYAHMVIMRLDSARADPGFVGFAINVASVSPFDNAGGTTNFSIAVQATGDGMQVDMDLMGTGVVPLPEDEWVMIKAQSWMTGPTTKSSAVRLNNDPFSSGTIFNSSRDATPHAYQRSISGRMSNNNTNFIRGIGPGVPIDEWAIFGDDLTDQEWDWLYNGGSFRSYQEVKDLSGNGAGHAVPIPVALSVVIGAIHLRCGHEQSDYDAAELSELISGVVIESTVTGAEAINSIIGSHFADPSDYDGKIHYIKRGKPVILTLTEDDLIDEPDEAQRNNAIEYPKKVHFLGQRADLAYASSKSTSARYSDDAKVVGEITIGSPETYDDGTEPAEVAVKLHKVLWTEAEGEREWMIPDNYLGLVPTDNVGLSYRGELVRCRILNIEDTPGQRKLRMIRDRQSAYTANLTEIPNPPAPTPPQSSVVAPTIMAFIDTSALTDNADTLHYLVALSGANDNWAGAVLQQQLTGEFQSIDSTTLNSIMGVLQNTVPDASPYYTDTTNQVVVHLYTDDELESRTEAEFLSNGGAFFLSWQDSGQTQWEIMQFRDAVQDSNGDWVLSHLMRGRKNTETAEHPPGATFVWIDPAILREPAQTSWINTALIHRAVSNGQSPELSAVQTNEYVGNSQREWPVADLLLSRPTADSVLAEAIPRHRFGTSMNPIRSVNWDGYRWTATDGSNTINRDGTSDTETFDTTGWGSPVTVTVAQLNRLTGAGPTVSEEIV